MYREAGETGEEGKTIGVLARLEIGLGFLLFIF